MTGIASSSHRARTEMLHTQKHTWNSIDDTGSAVKQYLSLAESPPCQCSYILGKTSTFGYISLSGNKKWKKGGKSHAINALQNLSNLIRPSSLWSE